MIDLDEFSWASAVGRIKVLENNLLSRDDLNQIVESRNLEDSLRILSDSVYGSNIAGLDNPSLFPIALQDSLKDSIDYVMSFVPEPLVIMAYLARHDFHNLKVLAKSRVLDIPLEREALSGLGIINPDDIVDQIGHGRWEDNDMPSDLSQVLSALMIAFHGALSLSSWPANNLTAFRLDGFLDKFYYDWAKKVFNRFGYEGLNEFCSAEIDLLNLRMFIRGRRQSITKTAMDNILLDGGTIEPGKLMSVYEGSLLGFVEAYKNTPWGDLASDGVAKFDRKESLTLWEKRCEDSLMKVVRKFRLAGLGPEPVFGYLRGKETEARNLRIILAGKQSSLSPQVIAERLREAYV